MKSLGLGLRLEKSLLYITALKLCVIRQEHRIADIERCSINQSSIFVY